MLHTCLQKVINDLKTQGLVSGQVVIVLDLNSDDPSSNPVRGYNFFCKIVVEKNETKQKETRCGPFIQMDQD